MAPPLARRRNTTWPKPVPELTPDQLAIRDDFMRYFHEVYPQRFGAVTRFNHGYPLATSEPGLRTLEIGAGLGEHLEFEDARTGEYVAMELRDEMAEAIRSRHPEATTLVGDVEQGIPAPDASFDRVLAIHVLEHLPDLPTALDEVHRVLRPGGTFSIVIPCEGGLGYALGRRFTSQRIFERRYGTGYGWYIKTEHFNVPAEIVPELDARFRRTGRRYWPLLVPSVHLNLCIGMTYAREA